jgi:hypothetical protein
MLGVELCQPVRGPGLALQKAHDALRHLDRTDAAAGVGGVVVQDGGAAPRLLAFPSRCGRGLSRPRLAGVGPQRRERRAHARHGIGGVLHRGRPRLWLVGGRRDAAKPGCRIVAFVTHAFFRVRLWSDDSGSCFKKNQVFSAWSAIITSSHSLRRLWDVERHELRMRGPGGAVIDVVPVSAALLLLQLL